MPLITQLDAPGVLLGDAPAMTHEGGAQGP